jgi:hypothetical protein
MRTKLMLASLIAMALVGCGDVQGNGDIVEVERLVGPFTGVFLAEGLYGEVIVGPEPSVRIRGDSNLLEYIQLRLRDGVLTSELDGSMGLMPSEPIVVTIVTPTLKQLRAANGTRLSARGVSTGNLLLGASTRARVSVSGSARRLILEAANDSDVQAGELSVEMASINVSGSTDVRLNVTQEISGAASGRSSIIIQGNPFLREISTSGGSQVHFE